MNEHLIEGAYLLTLNSQALTNAIIAKVKDDTYYVLTDFGNILRLTKFQLLSNYKVSERWIQYSEIGYPYSSVEDRIKEQIASLEISLEAIKQI